MQKVVTRFFVCVMMFFLITVIVRIFTREVFIRKLHINNIITQTIFFDNRDLQTLPTVIDWKQLYPFSENQTALQNSFFDRFKSLFFKYRDGFEKYTKDYLINYTNFVEIAVHYENVLGWRLNDGIFEFDDGWFAGVNGNKLLYHPSPTPPPPHEEEGDISNPIDAMLEFDQFLQCLNIPFLYVQSPSKISQMSIVNDVLDFSNSNADVLLQQLSINNISYLDLREKIYEEGLDYYNLFYKTDHHWKSETGLWAAKKISEFLNTNNNFDIDTNLFDPSCYKYDVYKKQFLGSLGRRVTLARAQPEDISLIFPLFDTDVLLQIPTRNIDVRGKFEVFYRYDQVDTIDYYNLNPYAAYLYGNNPIVVINNYLSSNDKKVLFIKDSFVICVAPFFALGVKTIELLDVRYFTGSVKTFIKKSNPDMIIVMYNTTAVQGGNSNMEEYVFNFN
jgi:hypothetical protein